MISLLLAFTAENKSAESVGAASLTISTLVSVDEVTSLLSTSLTTSDFTISSFATVPGSEWSPCGRFPITSEPVEAGVPELLPPVVSEFVESDGVVTCDVVQLAGW